MDSTEPRAAFLCRWDAHNTYTNQAYQRMTGCTAEELLGLGWNKTVHPDDLPAVLKQAASFREAGCFHVEYRLLHKDGSWRWVDGQSVDMSGCWSDDEIYFGIIQDITHRKEAEEFLRISEEGFALAVRGSNDGLWDWDIRTDKVFYSDRYREILGIHRSEIDDAVDFFKNTLHPSFQDSVMQALRNYLETRRKDTAFNVKTLAKNGNGEYTWVRFRGQALWDKNGAPLRMAGSLSDISESKAWEQEQERLIANLSEARDKAESAANARSDFLAVMSHEIKTPLNGVIGMVAVLLETNTTPEQQECLEIVQSSGECLLSIINDILDFSKIDAGKLTISPVSCNIQSVVEDVGSMLALRVQSEIVELVVNYRAPFAVFFVDTVRLRQVLLNLIGNACKFTHEGHIVVDVSLICGTCKQGTEHCYGCNSFKRKRQNGKYSFEAKFSKIQSLKFSIIDSGIGIPEHKLGHIFQKFTQCDGSTRRIYGGTGLGLAVSKNLVELMGGSISVESEEGKGSTFSFCLPLQLDEAEEVKQQNLWPNRNTFKGRRALIIDNHQVSARVLCEQLRALQFESEHMDSANAYKLLLSRENNSTSRHFDVAIIDKVLLAELLKELGTVAFKSLNIILLKTIGHRVWQGDVPYFRASVNRPVRKLSLKDALLRALDISVCTEESVIAPPRKLDAKKARILIVEDNKVNQLVALRLLNILGCSVDIANNGKEALTIVVDNQQQYDLIFMDCHMPVLDGFEASRQIREWSGEKGRPIIVALTAASTERELQRCVESGMDDHVGKPCTKHELDRVLQKWLSGG